MTKLALIIGIIAIPIIVALTTLSSVSCDANKLHNVLSDKNQKNIELLQKTTK